MKKIDNEIDELLVKIIMDKHPELLDDELSDVLNNERLVAEAMQYLSNYLNTYKIE